jgi:hypothetical protein
MGTYLFKPLNEYELETVNGGITTISPPNGIQVWLLEKVIELFTR